jgi:hypothetical protein
MKYRIKVKETKDGSLYYSPQVRHSWYQPWFNVLDYGIDSHMTNVYVRTEHQAVQLIETHLKKQVLNEKKKTKSTKYINIK